MKGVKPKRKKSRGYKGFSGTKPVEPPQSIKEKPKTAHDSKATKPPASSSLMHNGGGATKAAPASRPAKPSVTPRKAIDPALIKDVGGFVNDPRAWFLTPNGEFEGRKPIELLGTPDEERLRNRIEASKLGLFS